MSPLNQKRVVRDMLHELEEKIVGLIDQGHVPDDWEAPEMREMVFEFARISRLQLYRNKERYKAFHALLGIPLRHHD